MLLEIIQMQKLIASSVFAPTFNKNCDSYNLT